MPQRNPYVVNWEKAVPIVPQNFLISSDWGNKGSSCHYHPSYDFGLDKHDMNKIIGMHYARIWHWEKSTWEKRCLPKKPKNGGSKKPLKSKQKA